MTVKCEVFASMTKSWELLVGEAAEFATKIGKARLISISVSEAGGADVGGRGSRGSVFVWYWD